MDKRLKKFFELCEKAGAWPIHRPEVALEEVDRCCISALKLAHLQDKYKAGDSLALLEAVQLAWEDEFHLPLWAYGRLADTFTKYLTLEGGESLDALLDLKRRRGRNNDPFKRRDRKGLNNEIVFHVCLLNKYLKFSLPVTYFILSKMKIEYGDGRKVVSTVLSASRIKEIYDAAGRKYSLEELNDFGYEPKERFDCFWRDYAETFSSLFDSGALHKEEMLSSALRSFRALFLHIEPLPLTTDEESGG